jgi:hypothetical protein
MLFTAEDVEAFQKAGIHVVITCHEYVINKDPKRPGGEVLNIGTRKVISQADRVLFFNDTDYEACKEDFSAAGIELDESKVGQAFLTTPLTLTTEVGSLKGQLLKCYSEKTLKDKANEIDAFASKNIINLQIKLKMGEITAGDYDLIVDKITNIRNRGLQTKEDCAEYIALAAAQGVDVSIEPDLSLGELPVEFHFNATRDTVVSLCKRCSYSLGYDAVKGFANNASAMLTAISYGSLLFANRGCGTEDVDKVPLGVEKSAVKDGKTSEETSNIHKAAVCDLMKKLWGNAFSEDRSMEMSMQASQTEYWETHLRQEKVASFLKKEFERTAGVKEVYHSGLRI